MQSPVFYIDGSADCESEKIRMLDAGDGYLPYLEPSPAPSTSPWHGPPLAGQNTYFLKLLAYKNMPKRATPLSNDPDFVKYSKYSEKAGGLPNLPTEPPPGW